PGRPASWRLPRRWRSWAGPTDAIFASTCAGARATRSAFADTRRNWSRSPDVILASGSGTTGPLLQATRAVPVVFVQVADPVGAGFVDSLARPGETPAGSPRSNMLSPGNGWNFSKRSRPA